MKNNKFIKFVKKNSPIILSALGMCCTVGAVICAAKAGPKARDIIEKNETETEQELTLPKKIIATVPTYIPTIIFTTASIGCAITACVLNKKQQAALTSAYIVLDNAFKRYKNKVKELYGDDTCDKIERSLMSDVIEATPPMMAIPQLGGPIQGLERVYKSDDYYTFYDSISGRIFESTPFDVLTAEYHLSRNFMLMCSCAVNDFYDFLGITQLPEWESKGWTMDDGVMWIDFDHQEMTLDDGMKVIAIIPTFPPDSDVY